jgi:adenine-specific DNA-methyltransferase
MNDRLQLIWPNKDKFLLVPKDDAGKPVWVEPDHPAAREVRLSDFGDAYGEVNEADPYADNLMFCGDSLDVLRIMNEVPEYARHYRGKVKLVYIDPPFNTGQTFTHYDDWMEHSTWLSFMRDRLLAIKELLSADGSVWVHLDDAEVHRMRCLMDEVFGAENYISTVVWEKVHNRKNDDRFISSAHDTLVIYARQKASAVFRNLPATAEQRAMYKNPDNDPRGDWSSVPFSAQNVRPNLTYPITGPSGAVHMPPAGNCWRTTQERFEQLLVDGRIYFGVDGNGRPRMKQYWSESSDRGIISRTVWPHIEVGHTQGAKAEMASLFGKESMFSTPKPERLLERVIHIGTNPGDIVLDCFGGSGTTAAVAHKMGRRWVTGEILPETIKTFTSARLQKVVAGEDPGGITESVGWEGGGGFREVSVAPSMYEITPVGVMLADWATDGRFARAVAGQLGFEWQTKNHAPFCGVRGRMRFAVFDGAVGVEETSDVLAALGEKERVTIVAKVVLPGVEEYLAEHSRGSRVKKAPRDLLAGKTRRRRKAEETPT